MREFPSDFAVLFCMLGRHCARARALLLVSENWWNYADDADPVSKSTTSVGVKGPIGNPPRFLHPDNRIQ